MIAAMGAHSNQAPALLALNEQQRNFVIQAVKSGNYVLAKTEAGYADSVDPCQLLRDPRIAAALRAEVARQLATDGASIGYGTLKRIAQDQKSPAAAQVAAAKALLQGAGLLDQPPQSNNAKAINDMTRDELRSYIESKRQEIDGIEKRLAEGARDVTPKPEGDAFDPFA